MAEPTPAPWADTPEVTKRKQKEEMLNRITDVLKEYEMESNIPVAHEYWDLLNRYRSM